MIIVVLMINSRRNIIKSGSVRLKLRAERAKEVKAFRFAGRGRKCESNVLHLVVTRARFYAIKKKWFVARPVNYLVGVHAINGVDMRFSKQRIDDQSSSGSSGKILAISPRRLIGSFYYYYFFFRNNYNSKIVRSTANGTTDLRRYTLPYIITISNTHIYHSSVECSRRKKKKKTLSMHLNINPVDDLKKKKMLIFGSTGPSSLPFVCVPANDAKTAELMPLIYIRPKADSPTSLDATLGYRIYTIIFVKIHSRFVYTNNSTKIQ